MLRWDLTCSPLQLGQVLPKGNKVPSSASGPAPFAFARVGPTQTSGAVGDCVPFAPRTGAQSAEPLDHSTTERTSQRAYFEAWFRRAARGTVESVPGACVAHETTARRVFPRKPVKKSRVAQPVVDALDRASIIAAYEEYTRAHSSVGPRDSAPPHVGTSALLLVWRHHRRSAPHTWRDPCRLCASQSPRLLFWYACNLVIRCAFLANWDSLLTISPTSNVKEPSDQSILRGVGPSARQGQPLPLDEQASLPQANELWAPNGPVGPKGHVSHLCLVATSGNRNSSGHL